MLPTRNTKDLISPETRICALVYCRAKKGKTTFAAGLDTVTRKYRGKPTLFIASEVAEGGGLMSVAGQQLDFVMPQSFNDMEQVLSDLATDTKYGGVVLDNATDYCHRYVKPHALSFPCKEKVLGARSSGVPVRSDYQTMGEVARQQLNKLVNLTTKNTKEQFRKDLFVTALEKDKMDDDGKVVLATLPDLPGALADAITAMFQSVVGIKVKQQVVPTGEGTATKKVSLRVLHTAADGVRITDDRMGMFTHEFPLTRPDGTPQGLLELYEAFLERIKK